MHSKILRASVVVASVLLSVWAAATSSRPTSASVGGVGEPLTRAQIIARAEYWMSPGVHERTDYDNSRDPSSFVEDLHGAERYAPDCSGYVSMAWHLSLSSGGWSTEAFKTYRDSHPGSQIAIDDLLPGDAIWQIGHVELFDRWVNPDKHDLGAYTYSENSTGQQANHDVMSWAELQRYVGIRYDKIIKTVRPTPVPTWSSTSWSSASVSDDAFVRA
jgi:hypothetical protein